MEGWASTSRASLLPILPIRCHLPPQRTSACSLCTWCCRVWMAPTQARRILSPYCCDDRVHSHPHSHAPGTFSPSQSRSCAVLFTVAAMCIACSFPTPRSCTPRMRFPVSLCVLPVFLCVLPVLFEMCAHRMLHSNPVNARRAGRFPLRSSRPRAAPLSPPWARVLPARPPLSQPRSGCRLSLAAGL